MTVDLLLETMTQIRSQGVTVPLVEQDVHAALSVADRGVKALPRNSKTILKCSALTSEK